MESSVCISPKIYNKPPDFSVHEEENDGKNNSLVNREPLTNTCSLPIIGNSPFASPNIQLLLFHIPEGESDHSGREIVKTDSSGILLDGSWDCFQKLFPKIKISGNYEKVRKSDILHLIETLQATTADMRDSLTKITITEWIRLNCGPGASACANRLFFSIVLNPNDLIEDTIIHEIAHTLTAKLSRLHSPFIDEWKRAAGNVYLGVFSELKNRLGLGDPHNDFAYYNGCMNKYGATNIYEDVAVFTERVTTAPLFVASLLNKSNHNYDPRYLAKFNLLRKYHFISEEQYKALLTCRPR